MAASFPIIVRKLVNLMDEPFHLPEKAFRYGSLSIESDRYICIKDVAPDGTNQVVVVDLHQNNTVTRQPTKKAEAALMHTCKNIIVLRGRSQESPVGHFIQIFDLDKKARLLDQHFDEDVVYWKWASDSLLAVVTTKSVWHCSLEPNTPPVKAFDRGGRLADSDVQIIHYTVDASVKWCLLAGISTKDKKTIDGSLQLYSIERKQQQLLDGHAGCFGTLVTSSIGQTPIGVFTFAERKDGRFIVHVMHIESSKSASNGGTTPPDLATPVPTSFKVAGQFSFPEDTSQDFPIYMHLSASDGLLYLVSRGGHLVLMDPFTATVLFVQRVSSETVFASCSRRNSQLCAPGETGCGVLFVNRKGTVYAAGVREAALVPYVQQNLRHLPNCQELALGFVRRYGYSGGDEFLIQTFNAVFARGDYAQAARIAAMAKAKHVLRTPKTLQQFKAAPPPVGSGLTPLLQYFTTLLEYGTLTAMESIELVQTVVSQGHVKLVDKWLDADKLECTEELGDLIKPKDASVALRVYEKAGAVSKVLQSYVELGYYDKIIPYASSSAAEDSGVESRDGYGAAGVTKAPDYASYLRTMVASTSPSTSSGAVKFAQQLLNHQPHRLVEVDQVVDIFMQSNRLQELTTIMLDYLKGNRPEQGQLQTKLLELNLLHAPQVAEAIFQTNSLTHYDRQRIGRLCERAGLPQRALEHSSDPSDIKRILASGLQASPFTKGSPLNAEWLTNYFGSIANNPDLAVECLSEMLRTNRQNLQVVVQVAVKHHQQIGTQRLVTMFETFGTWEGVYYFLGSLIAFSKDPDVHFKYIEAASMLNNIQEVERVCRECPYYDAVRVKDFLKQAKLVDPRPLIYVCDLHGFVPELAEYLYRNSLMKFIEVYVVKVSPQKAPVVVGVLLDLDCPEDFIKSLLQSVRGACPVSELVAEVEKRNRLRMLLPWLEGRASEGNQDPSLHNALAKIYIDTNREPEEFLKTNAFYDSKVVGKYCEDRDPHLAYTAYKKNWGLCDQELVDLTNRNGLFRLQARYLVERQCPDLWRVVLEPTNQYRDAVVDQVVASALPESTAPSEISATVCAFVAANIPHALMELLEKIVLHNSTFAQNKSLQNLLILTAIKSDPSRVADYVNRLDNYDGPEVAQVAVGDDCRMYEEAFTIYHKCGKHEEAVNVLLSKIKDLERATDYATRCSLPGVWSCVGKEQLLEGNISAAIDAFLKAEDPSCYAQVIGSAGSDRYPELIQYLTMARKTLPTKDSSIDSEMVFALAKCGKLSEMEEFVAGSNTANVGAVGDRLFEDGSYEAAKVLYAALPNYPKLAACHLRLNEFKEAVDAAKRAGSPKTWTEVNIACVKAGEFRAAHAAGLAILGHPDHLEELIRHYEQAGRFEQLVALLEAGVTGGERPSVALLTELGVVYAKYAPEKLSSFLRSAHVTASGKLHIPKLVRACERELLWKECVQLHIAYEEYDQAASTMMSHPSAWSHSEFIAVLQQASNSELYYKAIGFYLDVAPLQLTELLLALCSKLDHGRVVQQLRKVGHPRLLQPYLEHVQQQLQLDLPAVNTALNDIYLEAHDVAALERSVSGYPSFDRTNLARQLESHPLLDFRKLAAALYRRNQRFDKAIALAKQDGFDQDAIEAAENSGCTETAEQLLRYFISERHDLNCFLACIVRCYHLVRPDVVLELAWRHKCTDQIMPFVIQTIREYTTCFDRLERRAVAQQGEAEQSVSNDFVSDYRGVFGTGHLALMPPPTAPASTESTDTSKFAAMSSMSRLLM